MSKIIIVCGGGGKTSYIKKLSESYKDKKVVITTTAKIFKPEKYTETIDAHSFDNDNIIVLGKEYDEKKLMYAGDEQLENAIKYADIILIEADGSKYYPIKIPNDEEPVIPAFLYEKIYKIVVVMGLHSLKRKFKEVCFRYNLCSEIDSEKIVDLETIKYIADKYYVNKLKCSNIELYLNDFTKNNSITYRKTAFIILASGKSERFSGNKLIHNFKSLNNKTLFENTINKISDVRKLFKEDEKLKNIETSVIVVSIYDDIINKKFENKDYISVYNNNHDEGISSSIKLGINEALKLKADSFVFFVCDMPFLEDYDIFNMLKYFYYSHKNIGAMFTGDNFSNPGVFSSKYINDILNLEYDSGALKIIKKNIEDCFFYTIDKNKLKDIDTREDLF
ncbi:molybdopterin-guanine dinucleotide biosynthesis protein MobA [Brachyspira hampsonii]|uniref:Molybdopterin-guanine dinucleotide biosynthesis protein MobA n=1 Tax=Brachyspira hampsonii TaxID=1287055 RepID=A0A1E5NBA4_9SPIR|nr:selenium cofactor biosynthesis protein YqeC [Brachyspira hampsonii]OEJ13435.1 molybdopterin-guanine dinucleotide biosynthesis protein MobA [Brachyspira hampsonii]